MVVRFYRMLWFNIVQFKYTHHETLEPLAYPSQKATQEMKSSIYHIKRIVTLCIYYTPVAVFSNIFNLCPMLMTFILVKIGPNLEFTKHILARTISLI